MKAELLTALQPALAKVSAQGVRPSEIPAHTEDLTEALKEELSDLWTKLRGIEIVTININSAKIPDEDAKTIADLQRTAVLRNTGMAAATMTAAQAEAMKMAASNTSTGPMMAFAGMNMANMVGGINAGQLYQMDAQQNSGMQQAQAAPARGRLLRCRHRYLAGPVAAALRITVVSFALSVEHLSLRTQAGPAAVVQ